MDIREKAKEILKAVPEPPAQINSDGATAAQFTKMTGGVLHSTLLAKWAQNINLTCCNEFVGWYGGQLGSKKYLGRFDLETYLPSIGKGGSWVKSTTDVRPKYGDICRHTAFHVGVSLDFKGDSWNHVDAGQGGPKAGHDVLKRTYATTPYDYKKLQGWIDLDLYFGSAAGRPIPPGIIGWWKVTWRGSDYFYYFDRSGQVKWSRNQPQTTELPMVLATDTGNVSIDDQNVVTIQWGNSGSVEKYALLPAPGDNEMKGKWNDCEPIKANKM